MKKSSVKKNFAYQMIYEVLVLILPFVTSPYIARVIGAEGLGTFSYSYSVAYYFILFSNLGLKNYGNRAIAQSRDNADNLNKTFSNIVVLHALLSLVCVVAYIGYCLFIAEDELYAFIQLFYVISAIFDISWLYFGIENFKLTVTRNVIIKLINVVCVFAFVHNANDLWKYCLIMSLGNLFSQMTLWIPLRQYVRFVRPSIEEMRVHLKPMLILFIPAIAVSLYKYMDKIMIGAMSNKAQLGFYENAEKVINIPTTVIGSFGTVMLPKMSNLAKKRDGASSEKYINLSMQFVMCLAFAMSFGLAAVGTVFAPIFWGTDFFFSGYLIMGLASTIPFISFANVIRTQYLIPMSRDREYMTSVIAGAIVNLIFNSLLIPTLGAAGATVGTILAEATVCIIQAFVVRRELPVGNYLKNSVFFLTIGIFMFFLVYKIGVFFGTRIATLFIQIVVGAIFYLTLCSIHFYKTKNEIFMRAVARLKRRLLKT